MTPSLTLTQRFEAAVRGPVTHDAFDLHSELDSVLSGVKIDPADSGGVIAFVGADPIVPSPLRIGGAAAIALVAKSVAISKLWRLRGALVRTSASICAQRRTGSVRSTTFAGNS